MTDKAKTIGMVIATHRSMGAEMLLAASGIVGDIENATAISIHYGKSPDEARDALIRAVDSVESGAGVMIFTDMFGGTPTNISLSLIGEKNIEVVTGVSLPMIIKAHSARKTMELSALAAFIRDYGAKNIIVAGELFKCSLKDKN
ncbi:PTS sugar transporter subunit IIA [bacterium]|nr:MAG: PTS sugar transporter subunit IIA [bacterium]